MFLPSILLAAVSVYTIPSGTTYTLKASDPSIGAETVVNIEAGGVLDMNTFSPTIAGITGAGVVSNGAATLSLAGGPYRFDGLVYGTLAFAQGDTPASAFGLIVGGSNTLAAATVNEPTTSVHPLRFADGVAPFNCGSLVCADGPTLKLESVTRKPVKLVAGLANPDSLAATGKGSLHIAAGAGKTITLKNDVIKGLTGQIGAASGTLKLDSTLDVSTIGGYYVQTDATLYLRDKQTREVLTVPLSSDGEGTVYFRSPMEIDGTTVRLTCLYVQDDCTNIVFRDSMFGDGTKQAMGLCWNSKTNVVEISGFGGLRTGYIRVYDHWWKLTGLGYTPGYFWDIAQGPSWEGRGSLSYQGTLEVTVRDGGIYTACRSLPAAAVTALPGGVFEVRYSNPGPYRTLIDGGRLDLVVGDMYCGFSLSDGDGNFPVHIGPRGATVRGFQLSSPAESSGMTYNNRFLSAGGTDGGVRFVGMSVDLRYPIGFNGPLRVDGLVYFSNAIIGHCTGDESPDVANDVVIGNGTIASCYTERDMALATGAGKKITLDGSATFRANGSQAYVLGPTGAATGAAVQRNRGSALFFLRKTTAALDGSDARLLVNGGLENDSAAGIVKGPCFTVILASNNGTRVDFARYDDTKGLVAFTGYADSIDAGEDTVPWIRGKNVTVSSSAHVRGLVIDSSACWGDDAPFILAQNVTLTVGNGTDPAVVVLNGNGNAKAAGVSGAGTLDFGSSEGVVVCHRTQYSPVMGEISAKVTGSNGLSLVTPCDQGNWNTPAGVVLSNAANDYTGDTYVNGPKLEVRANGALSTGDVYIGRGIESGGTLLLAGSCSELTNAVHFAGWGCHGMQPNNGYESPALHFYRHATLSGPIELTNTVRFGCARNCSYTGTLSNVIYGSGELQLWTGCYRLKGKNTYSGGTLIAKNTKVALDGDDVGFGTGPVTIDPAEIDLCGTRHTLYALRGTGKILNTGAKRATLTLEHGLDLSAGEISGNIKIVVKGGTVRIGADVTLGEDVSFQLAPGTRVDWCGRVRPIRQFFGGQALNGAYTESHPKGAAVFLR